MKKGSSPLTRGKLREIAQLHEGGGLIPAHAGKTCLPRRRCISHGAHPRSRGENRCSGAGGRSSSGSSPLTRGKRHHPVLQRVRGRLIPAHAGKTFQAELEMIQDRAHPRSRGENLIWSLPDATAGGSSPLTRGKRRRGSRRLRNCGLIPAHAGKTVVSDSSLANFRAHPRSRGENPTAYRGNAANAGSSPLTRGKPLRGLPGAGPEVAHPRSRGENARIDAAIRLAQGSSPLTRGKRPITCAIFQCKGLIPAHAGKTVARSPSIVGSEAHPRSRGENRRFRSRCTQGAGSSPLTRGKHYGGVVDGDAARLIPAHAGKTR